MNQKLIITIMSILFCVSIMYGQKSYNSIDTVGIYKNKKGVRYKVYLRHWFFFYKAGKTYCKKGGVKSYSWNDRKKNEQDSLVLDSKTPYYFKVYNRYNKLLLEGQKMSGMTDLIGDIIFYYKNGNVKRIEHFGNDEEYIPECGFLYGINSEIGPEGIWKYYYRNGGLRKIIEYQILINSCKMSAFKVTTMYKRNGKIKKTETVEI